MRSGEQGCDDNGLMSYFEFPYDSFEIITSLPLEETIAFMQSNVEPRKIFRMEPGLKVFEGDVSPNGFTISRIRRWRSNQQSIIRGKFIQRNTGTTIQVWIRPYYATSISISIWLSIVAYFMIKTTDNFFECPLGTIFMLLYLFGMMCFGWGLFTIGFWIEAKKSKRKFLEIFWGNQNYCTPNDRR